MRDNGGTAFPTIMSNDDGTASTMCDSGMMLRDYFAAKALAGVLSADTEYEVPPGEVAAYAYKVADAMLAAREK